MADESEKELLRKSIEDSEVIVFPPPLISYYLECGGCMVEDEQVLKLASREIHRFVQEILEETKNYKKLPKVLSNEKSGKRQRVDVEESTIKKEELVLRTKDVQVVLNDNNEKFGILVSSAPYHPLNS